MPGIRPYQELQIAYAAVALVIAAALWRASGRVWRPERLVLRWAGASAAACVAGLGFHAALRPFGPDIASLFIAVAVVFYALGFWLPGLVLVSAWRRRS